MMEGYATYGVAAQLVSKGLERHVRALDLVRLLDENERAARGVIASFLPNTPAFLDLLTRARGPVIIIDSRFENSLSGLSLTGLVRSKNLSRLK